MTEDIVKDSTKSIDDVLRLKVPEHKKNDKWYESVANHFLPPFNDLESGSYDESKALYELFNNDITAFEEEIAALCDNTVDLGAAIEEILPYNKIRNKFEILSGDLLKRANNHRLLLLTAKAIRKKKAAFVQQIAASVNKDLNLVLEKAIEDLEQLSPSQLREFIEQERQILTPKDLQFKNYLSDLEIYKNKMLKYSYIEQDITTKKVDTFKDMFIDGGLYIYPGWKHGRPHITICNPLFCGYVKSPDEPFVHKGDAFWHRDDISVGQVIDEYMHVLSDDDLAEVLRSSSYYNNWSSDHLKRFVFDHTQYYATIEVAGLKQGYYENAQVGLFQTPDSTRYPFKKELIKRVHLEFKAYKEVMFFTYRDDYNEPITVMLEKNTNIIPENAQKVKFQNKYGGTSVKYVWADEFGDTYEAQILYIPRRYELTRLGNNQQTLTREVPNQPDLVNDPFRDFELTYKGGKFNNRNAEGLSPMQAALPYQFQIFAVKALENREIAKYRGFEIVQDIDQLPTEMGTETGNESEDAGEPNSNDAIMRNEVVARKTGTRFVSPSAALKGANGLIPHNRGKAVEVIKIGSAQELVNLQTFANMLDVELGLAVGVPPQREGQMIPYTNVSDNQQSLFQTSLQTELMYYMHNKVWSHVLNEHLINYDTYFRIFFKENPDSQEHLLEYVLPDRSSEIIKVMPEFLNHEDIGLYLHDTGADKVYMEMMLQKIAQNTIDPNTIDSLSAIIKAITSGASTEEVHRMLEVEGEKQRKRIQEIEKQKMETIGKEKEARRELMKYQSNLDAQKELLIEDKRIKGKLDYANIDVKKFALQHDINENKESDANEREELRQKHEDKRHAEEMKLEREKLQNQKDIEKMRSNSKKTDNSK